MITQKHKKEKLIIMIIIFKKIMKEILKKEILKKEIHKKEILSQKIIKKTLKKVINIIKRVIRMKIMMLKTLKII